MRFLPPTRNLLSPEQHRALEVLQNADLSTPKKEALELTTILQHNSKFHSMKNLSTKDLPKGDYWIWNQSRRRETVSSDSITVCFYKLSAKVKPKRSFMNPGYKLWVFNIESKSLKSTLLWCEKGITGNDTPRPIPETSYFPNQISLHQELQAPQILTPRLPKERKPWEIEMPNDGTLFSPFPDNTLPPLSLPPIRSYLF